MKKKVNVTLKENMENLGISGDEISVSLGYAKNYLIPKGLVITKNDPDYKKIKKAINLKRVKIKEEIKDLQKIADEIKGKIFTFQARAASDKKLFGSINPDDLAKKIGVDKKYIVSGPLKNLGEYTIDLKFPQNVTSNVIIKIEAEKSLVKTRDKVESKKDKK